MSKKTKALLTTVSLLHSVSLRITDFGIWVSDTGERLGSYLWETGGALECWCDGKARELGVRETFKDLFDRAEEEK